MRSLFLLLILGAFFACNEEITVGSSILEDTGIDVEFTTGIDVEVKTVLDDTVVVYRSSIDSRTYLLGQAVDPVFGSFKSNVYLSSGLINTIIPFFDTLRIDSVVMSIPLDTLGQSGNEESIHNIKVYQLDEVFALGSENVFLASDAFSFNPTPVGETSKIVNHRDSLKVLNPERDSLIGTFPQLRIPMDVEFWRDAVSDTLISRDQTAFKEKIKGFVLTSEPSDNSFIGLNLLNSSAVSVILYYSSLNNARHASYVFDLGALRSDNFIHDYSGTPIESVLDLPATDFAYVQSMQGVNLNIDLKNVLALSDKIINRATLVFYLMEDGNQTLTSLNGFDAVYVNDQGTTQQTLDAFLESQSGLAFLGGNLESVVINGETVQKYEMDITSHVISVARGEILNTNIIIEAKNKPQRVSGSVLLGPSHPDLPITLRLVTSKP